MACSIPEYETHDVDRRGTILATSLKNSLTGEDIRGHNIREWLSDFDARRYLSALELSIIRGRPTLINYTILGVRFLAILEPLDDTVVRTHEIRMTNGMRETMRLMERIKGEYLFL
jgi:hypothetical protein